MVLINHHRRCHVICWFLLLSMFMVEYFVTSLSCGDGYFLEKDNECMKCPEHCMICDSTTYCLFCESGYWGRVCDLQCHKCKPGTSCEKTNGFCLDACKDGYTGILCDYTCDEKCLSCNRTHARTCLKCANGRYPVVTCNQTCSRCIGTDCDETGICRLGCVNNYWGPHCELTCSDNCIENVCFNDNGSCVYGCKNNFNGHSCNFTLYKTEATKSSTIYVMMSVGIACALLISAIFLYGVWRKRPTTATRHSRDRNPAEEDSPRQARSETLDRREEKVLTPLLKAMPQNKFDDKDTPQILKLRNILGHLQTLKDEDYQRQFNQLTSFIDGQPKSVNTTTLDKQEPCTPERNKVVVKGSKGDDHPVHANFIKGRHDQAVAYVASKGPTTKDYAGFSLFWRMLWTYKCRTVVMLNTLCKEAIESEQYWPNPDGKSVDYGMCCVKCTKLVKAESLSYMIRDFDVAMGNWIRKVTQLQILNWPESGIPENVHHLLNFWTLVVAARQKNSSPVIVHSRAGKGRTGTFIALDMLLNQVDDIARNGISEELDIYDCVVNLRRQRENMVENVEQYKLIHQALSAYIAEVIRKEKDVYAFKENVGTHEQIHEQKHQLESVM